MAKINIANGIISSSADYGLYRGTSKIVNIQDGEFRVLGDLIAENYIVSSSVSNIEYQSLSGSTIFGDSADDTHTFLGNTISGSATSTGSFGAGYIDNKLGIGETAPDELLHIKSSTVSNPIIKLENAGDVINGAQLHFVISTTSEGDNDILGTIRFKGQNDASEETEFETIYVRNIDVSNGTEDGELHFRTIAAGSLETSMIIKSGNVGIGNTNPPRPLTVQGEISASGRGTFGSHILTAGNVYLDGEIVLNSADSATTLTLGGDTAWTQVNYGKDTDVVHNFRGTMKSG